MKDPQAVAEPGVGCAGIDQVGGSQLLDAMKLLEGLGLDDFDEDGREGDVSPDRIPDAYGMVFVEMAEDLGALIHGLIIRRVYGIRKSPSIKGLRMAFTGEVMQSHCMGTAYHADASPLRRFSG
jgi:hypothetical protein